MSIPVGAKAEKEQFFGRVRELRDFWDLLDRNHVVLSGPRRLGKTSLLQRLVDDSSALGWHGVLLDLQGHDSVEAMLSELERRLPEAAIARWLDAVKRTTGRAADRLQKVEISLPGGFGGGLDLQPPPASAWTPQAHRLQARLASQPVLILVDEFSVFLERLIARDRPGAEQLLGWLRTWRCASNVQCRFVFSGSIGINTLLTRHRLITYFNDCYDFRLQAFSRAEAAAMVREELACERRPYAEEVPERICDRVGWLSPYYINLLLLESIRAARDRETEQGVSVSPMLETDVEDGYERLLAVRSRFVHWAQRLERDLAPHDLSFAMKVLASVSRTPEGLTRRQLLARLNAMEPDPAVRSQRLERALWHLEEDGYLSTDSERVRFLSFLLRDYWHRNHGR
jgi:hypothetical protein